MKRNIFTDVAYPLSVRISRKVAFYFLWQRNESEPPGSCVCDPTDTLASRDAPSSTWLWDWCVKSQLEINTELKSCPLDCDLSKFH